MNFEPSGFEAQAGLNFLPEVLQERERERELNSFMFREVDLGELLACYARWWKMVLRIVLTYLYTGVHMHTGGQLHEFFTMSFSDHCFVRVGD